MDVEAPHTEGIYELHMHVVEMPASTMLSTDIASMDAADMVAISAHLGFATTDLLSLGTFYVGESMLP